MIREIDEALRELVRTRALDGSDVEVVLDAPTTDWAARRNAPTVNLYLYDLREDTRWRERGWAPRAGADGTVTGRVPAPRLFKLSYLVTAWTARPEDEHRLLDALLGALLAVEILPPEMLGSDLEGVRVPLTVGLPPPEDRGFADVWSSLGGQLKPSIDVVLTAPFSSGADLPVGPPVAEPTVVSISDLRGPAQERAGGRRTRPEEPAPPTTSTRPTTPAKRARKPRKPT
ncbi:DUF4255 domain-containing protein [Georgenia satyanarayanai]|uniref:DUF4255 domain-containing protein n=1 Tax=Georgenia satyanarayanai TaxID=860221 RepID=UPI002041FB1F|nr:DUF4255 domain-containing protein [Georgenia satyanarayanai]MCM3661597.1 DUF4255 domain-containing protein [Georgenia satyanarayanai]